jgi:hypothetical protein
LQQRRARTVTEQRVRFDIVRIDGSAHHLAADDERIAG